MSVNGPITIADKRRLLRALEGRVRQGEEAWTGRELLEVQRLSKDADWSVRQDVAQLLVFLPEKEFNALASVLIEDTNAYVKRAAEHSRQRRRASHQEAKRASRGLDVFTEHFELFARKHGQEITAEALKLGERRFELVSAALAHDLLGTLALLQSYGNTVSSAIPKKHTSGRVAAKELNDGLLLMKQSLEEILAYSQEISVERATENLRAIVVKARQVTEKALEEQGIKISGVAIDDGGVPEITVEVSRHLMVRTLGNLIKNACETFVDKTGMVSPGKVTIAATKCPAHIEITVHNSGKGLSEEKLQALTAWLPAQKNRNKKNSRGYGLLNAKKIVEEHGGSLSFESGLNRGVTAIIRLPA